MGSCLSKKSTSCTTQLPKPPPQQVKPTTPQVEKNKLEEEPVKKEIFIIKHRKSHDVDRRSEEESGDGKKNQEIAEPEKIGLDYNSGLNGGIFVAAPVRTSSCTKEEVDAILIQCGRLSRSSSTGKVNFSGSFGSGETNGNAHKGRKYSGSKRSYDFENENGNEGRDVEKKKGIDGYEDNIVLDDDDGLVVGEKSHRHRQRQRSSRTVGSPSKGRRRTPSREREQGQQPRSGSRERGSSSSGSGGRRVSRSPGRRSESPITTSSGVSAAGNSSSGNGNGGNVRPGKMVSVPATVSSLAMDKSNNAGGAESISASAVKRIQVKRNVGADGARTAASPRARSPARSNVKILNENQQQQQPGSLSRSNSRKAETSPYRRNPLSEIDTNVIVDQLPLPGTKASNNVVPQAPIQKPNADFSANKISSNKGIAESNLANLNGKTKEQQQQQHVISEVAKAQQAMASNLEVNVIASGPECLKPQGVTRSRSSRLSRDLDINPEMLSNTSPSYTALLLEDIQNFHQKNTTSPAITLPPCLSKACSILEAVADLNSSTSSNLSSAFSEDKRRIPTVDQFNKYYDNVSFGNTPTGKKGLETKDPFVQSEVVVSDDIMEPSFHKYVTMRRGTVGGEDMEEQESSGSNSFVGGQQQYWVSPSSWEPNSADSIDCWTSSRSNIREENESPLGFQRHAISESGHDAEEARKRLNGKKRDYDQQQQQNGIGRGRIGSRGGLQHSVTTVPTAAST